MSRAGELMGYWLSRKILKYFHERKNKKIDKEDRKINREEYLYYGPEPYGYEEVFQFLSDNYAKNPEQNKKLKEYLLEELKSDPEVLLSWADTFVRYFELSKALLCSEVATILDPKNPEAWNIRGILYEFKQKYTDSVQCFQTAREYDLLNATIENNLWHINNGDKNWFYEKYAILKKDILNT